MGLKVACWFWSCAFWHIIQLLYHHFIIIILIIILSWFSLFFPPLAIFHYHCYWRPSFRLFPHSFFSPLHFGHLFFFLNFTFDFHSRFPSRTSFINTPLFYVVYSFDYLMSFGARATTTIISEFHFIEEKFSWVKSSLKERPRDGDLVVLRFPTKQKVQSTRGLKSTEKSRTTLVRHLTQRRNTSLGAWALRQRPTAVLPWVQIKSTSP